MGSEFLACPKELRLPTVRSCYEQQAEMARREGLSYERYLEQVPGARNTRSGIGGGSSGCCASPRSCDRSRLPPVDINQENDLL